MSFTLALGARNRKSPFYDATVAAGVTHFSTYNHMMMPVSYGDLQAEYQRLLDGVAMWDVACERQVQIEGPDAERLVRYLTPRDLKDLPIGRGKYVPLCDHDGRLYNDPVLLRVAEDRFWLSIADSDVLLFVRAVAGEGGFDVRVTEPDVSPLAIQGPKAVPLVADLFGEWTKELKYFWFAETDLDGIPLVLARSGWSKQGGFELYLMDGARGTELWNKVAEAGRTYGIGPGAPNGVERIESGLLSFGTDDAWDCDPIEAGLGAYVHLERADAFIGKAALKTRMAEGGPRRKVTGVTIAGPRIGFAEHPWPMEKDGAFAGTVRAACYSARLERNIAIALVEIAQAGEGETLAVSVPGEAAPREATVTPLPFIAPQKR